MKMLLLLTSALAAQGFCADVELLSTQRMPEPGVDVPEEIVWKVEFSFPSETVIQQSDPTPLDWKPFLERIREEGFTKSPVPPSIQGSDTEGVTWIRYEREGDFVIFCRELNYFKYYKQRVKFVPKNSEGIEYVPTVPDKKEAVKIAEDWATSMKLPAPILEMDPEAEYGVYGISYGKSVQTQPMIDPETGKEKSMRFKVETHPKFRAKIGELVASDYGEAGAFRFGIYHEGQISSVRGAYVPHKPLGTFPLLTKEGIEAALKERRYWKYYYGKLPTKRFVIEEIKLLAECKPYEKRQTHFVPFFRLQLYNPAYDELRPSQQPETLQLIVPAMAHQQEEYQKLFDDQREAMKNGGSFYLPGR